jgi:glucosamine--fructose-6-phosphate aminotransferase (isomerizing)
MGVIGRENAVPKLVNGLQHLSYRGYDAAGVAVYNGNTLDIRKTAGTMDRLRDLLEGQPAEGSIGIGHTRWATHGAPTDCNAHPHTDTDGRIAVVHNGIIENERVLRQRLAAEGITFRSQTDTEVVAHLIAKFNRETCDLRCALRKTVEVITGAYALVVMSVDEPDRLYIARKDSPIVIGLGKDAGYVASDIPALLPYTRDILLLEDGDIACLSQDAVNVTNKDGDEVQRPFRRIDWDQEAADKGEHTSFMEKEMDEQPEAAARLLEAPLVQSKIPSRVTFVACGSAYHASLIGKHYLAELAGIPATAEIASEFRYETPLSLDGQMAIAISQSGETVDTLMALRQAKERGADTAAIVNVQDSSIARVAGAVQWMHAGPEIAVATTKGFTTQVLALLRLALDWGRKNDTLRANEVQEWHGSLKELPRLMREVLVKYGNGGLREGAEECGAVPCFARQNIAPRLVFFLGRGLDTATAMEGALKLKEISYQHATAYPAGELKHGPIALIENDVLVVALATQRELLPKTISNIREVKARGARVLALCQQQDEAALANDADEVWTLPNAPDCLMPLLAVLPLQRLAYEVALLRGCSVDKPRNLAKSVTVE